MSEKWAQIQFINRESNIYSFSQNPLLKRNQNIHIFAPWDSTKDNELMFKMKDLIAKKGFVNIPLINKDGKSVDFPLDVQAKLNAQLEEGRETHLIMSNMDSIHVFRITGIFKFKDIKGEQENNLALYQDKPTKQMKFWVKLNDCFVLETNHDAKQSGIESQLNDFVSSVQTQNIFKPILRPVIRPDEASDLDLDMLPADRWVDTNRSVTYDYFIRSCELKDNIFQDSWNYLARKTQHELISCELERHNAIFYRDQEKWKYLNSSFHCYREAIFSELNSVYIFPFINAISSYSSLKEAWLEIDKGLVNPKIQDMICDLLTGKKKQLDSIEDFIYYTQHAKSLLFTLKQKFIRKIHKEEFLLVENFLIRQEGLVEAMKGSILMSKLQTMIDIKDWIDKTDSEIQHIPREVMKDCNLKLSHLLSIMVSASYQDNLFFRLIEEKAAKGIIQKSYDDVVKSLLSIELKKSA